jgi:hypothetical protein
LCSVNGANNSDSWVLKVNVGDWKELYYWKERNEFSCSAFDEALSCENQIVPSIAEPEMHTLSAGGAVMPFCSI